MEVIDLIARLAVTGSQWWKGASARLRITAGQVIAGMDGIPVWIEGVGLIVTGSQRLKVILGGGMYQDVGRGEGCGGRLALGQLQLLHVVDN